MLVDDLETSVNKNFFFIYHLWTDRVGRVGTRLLTALLVIVEGLAGGVHAESWMQCVPQVYDAAGTNPIGEIIVVMVLHISNVRDTIGLLQIAWF